MFVNILQALRANNSIILRIQNAKLSGCYCHMKTSIQKDFQICISVPLRAKGKWQNNRHLEYYLGQRNNLLIWQHLKNCVQSLSDWSRLPNIHTYKIKIQVVQRASKYRHFQFFFFFQVSKSFCLIPVILSCLGFVLLNKVSQLVRVYCYYLYLADLSKTFFTSIDYVNISFQLVFSIDFDWWKSVLLPHNRDSLTICFHSSQLINPYFGVDFSIQACTLIKEQGNLFDLFIDRPLNCSQLYYTIE